MDYLKIDGIIPFDAQSVAVTHSTLTGILAGFALTGLFLLIERVHRAKDEDNKMRYLKAMILLFIAFLTALLSSYLYSSNTGDKPPMRGYYLFQFPSGIFAIHALFLLAGINEIFRSFGIEKILTLARKISYCVVLFIVFIICNDLIITTEIYQLPKWVIKFVIAAIVPILISLFLIVFRIVPWWSWMKIRNIKMFNAFCYAGITICLIISFGYLFNSYNRLEELLIFGWPVMKKFKEFMIPWWPVMIMFSVSILGAWSMFLYPKIDP